MPQLLKLPDVEGGWLDVTVMELHSDAFLLELETDESNGGEVVLSRDSLTFLRDYIDAALDEPPVLRPHIIGSEEQPKKAGKLLRLPQRPPPM